MTITRRTFLGAAAAAPFTARGPFSTWLPDGDPRCLLVLELQGGNDGLNFLIPTEDPAYLRARPDLGVVRRQALAIGEGYALHPSCPELQALVRGGDCALVHGVGYPRPDRSHFRSRDIWYTADPEFERRTAATTGWLGRAADWLAARGAAIPAAAIASLELPLLLRGLRVLAPTLERVEDYQVLVDPAGGEEEARRRALRRLVEGGTAAGGELERYVTGVSRTAVEGAEKLRAALAAYRPRATFPDTALGRALRLVSQLVVSGFGTRLLHVPFGGFDTHARQLPAQAALLRQLSTALGALAEDLRAHGAWSRTRVLVYSEFGRRVAQNRSQGTDHGAAGPVGILGGGVHGGLHGRPPSLEDLRDGDLRPTCDFRELYGAVLRWLGVPEDVVLGRSWRGVDPLG